MILKILGNTMEKLLKYLMKYYVVQPSKKNDTIPAEVLPNDSEALFNFPWSV